ncbi:hypothetical protein GGI26_004872 [Coemansia sp. RSA 1358]|uniref:F-box domain-containing protein n=1 Tax=Coemansia umbellata TaxID=1424467 RepID=A0ABQ8PHX8_9FUNG|nr:hypothetical protein BX070DRAFT_219970 [Coemansia spiralis]KAJ1989608.1 hypothetical protein EDC05_004574 [Coemansia umbellata]KAJ2620583.1 hypothetical protein GGI26_004872 [Coemansia sp. RSA 1358]
MAAISIFQSLPLHIAESITRYLVGSYRLALSSESARLTKQKKALTSLYNVSWLWRSLALQYFCEEAIVIIHGDKVECDFAYVNWPFGIEQPTTGINRYVKKIWMRTEGLFTCDSGALPQALANVWPNGFVFPAARKLSIEVCGNQAERRAVSGETNNKIVLEIASHIQQSMPKLEIIDILDKESPPHWAFLPPNIGTSYSIDGLLSTFLPNLKRINLDLAYNLLVKDYKCLQCCSRLTSLQCSSGKNMDMFKRLIQQNLQTLHSLVILQPPSNFVSSLVQDDNGNLVVYPQLERLEICANSGSNEAPYQQTDKQVILFPVLKHLKIEIHYPFADDTLFRGNSSTMQTLSIVVNSHFLHIAKQHRIFGNGNYPNLVCISSKVLSSHSDEGLTAKAYLFCMLEALGPATRALTVPKLSDQKVLFSAIPNYLYFASVQILKLSEVELTIGEMIKLLKLLPALTDLSCRFRELECEAGNIKYDGLPEHLYSMHYPLNRNFKCWEILFSQLLSRPIATFATLLAILCPRFTYAVMVHGDMELFRNHIKDLVSAKPFSEYFERVQCLLERH